MHAKHLARPIGRNQTSATNRALLRPADAVRDTDRVVLRHIRSQASKFFNTEKQGGATEDHGEGQCGASRGARCNTARSATLRFSVVLGGSPFFSVLKDLLACLLA